MRSAGAPTATVLTVVTLVFAPVLKHNHTSQQLVDKDTTAVTVICASTAAKCPKQARMHESTDAVNSSPAAIQAAVDAAVAKAVADFQAAHPGTGAGWGYESDRQYGNGG